MKKIEDKIYLLCGADVLKKFSTGNKGLSNDEAEKRLEKYGTNKLKKKQDWTWAKLIANQFNSALVWILLMAAFLAVIFQQYRDATIVLVIVLINAIIGFFQEYKAERILQKIRDLTTDKALVIRNGEKREIESDLLVPGDLVFLSSGDNVPADGYLIESYDLYINDFIFTGESQPHKKDVGVLEKNNKSLGEITNMVFMGSMVTRGEGVFVVTGTGMQTELGKIAGLATEIHSDETPLQEKMRILSREVSILAVFIGMIVILVGRWNGISWYETFLFALALAVSVVPEGLPAALSVALSLGMKRLLKDSVLAKKLTSVETLGSVSVICTDKTGTITRNELMVTRIVLGANTTIDIDGEGYAPKGNFYVDGKKIKVGTRPSRRAVSLQGDLQMLFKIGVLCNDADLTKQDGQYKIIGDPTEGAIIVAAKKYSSGISRIFAKEKKIDEMPFSSERMRMSVIYKNSEVVSYVKGSPDVLIDRCALILENGKTRKMTKKDKDKVRKIYNEMSGEALRVLAFTYRDLSDFKKTSYYEESEKNLVWVGLMGMIDPPRKEVAKAIKECQSAGIKVMMITGDYEVTAKAIAEKVGLIEEYNLESRFPIGDLDSLVINGKTLDQLTDNEIIARVSSGNVVFARINPDQKLRIATILKKSGLIIAMTGDGVNDALALKKADIGVAMGNIGTDVAKEASDMILLDDNFASIVRAIKEGRTIYQNIKKFVHYVFTSNASELFTVVLGVILGIPTPLTAIQILATDLGTDLFPSLSLGVDPSGADIMKEKPYDPKEKVVTKQGFLRLLFLGMTMAICAVLAFLWSMKRGGWVFGSEIDENSWLYIKSTTVAYAVISMTQMANVLHSRSETKSPFQIGFFKNRFAIGSIFISVLMLLSFIYLPFFQKYLHLANIDFFDWLTVILSVLVVYTAEEVRKFSVRKSLFSEQTMNIPAV